MARLAQVSGRDVKKALIRAGYYPVSQRGTLRGIITDAGLTTDEFWQLLKNEIRHWQTPPFKKRFIFWQKAVPLAF